MGTVDLDNCLNNTLFYRFHSIEFFIKNSAGFLRVNCFKIIIFPLNVHHNGQCSLCMSSLLRRYFMRAGNCKVSSCPQTNIIRQGSACAGHKISNALNTCQLHLITGFLFLFFLCGFYGCTACQKSLNHKLEKSIFCRKLCSTPKCSLPNLINCITILMIFS